LSYAAADTTMVHVSFPAADPLPDETPPDDTPPGAVSSETKAMHACAGVHSRARAGVGPPRRAGIGFFAEAYVRLDFRDQPIARGPGQLSCYGGSALPAGVQIGGRCMSRKASPARWRIRHEGGHGCSL
jgi:hypothetical protein